MVSRWKHTVPLVLALGLTLSAFAVVPGSAKAVEYHLYGSAASGWGWAASNETSPGPTLTVTQGDSVTITVHATDSLPHTFFIDMDRNGAQSSGDPGTSGQFSGSQAPTVTFTAGAPGTYNYYCGVHPTSMRGSFVILASGSPSPSGGDSTLLYVGLGVVAVAIVGVVAYTMRKKKA